MMNPWSNREPWKMWKTKEIEGHLADLLNAVEAIDLDDIIEGMRDELRVRRAEA